MTEQALLKEDSRAELNELVLALQGGGVKCAVECLEEKTNKWKTAPINLAVVGRSGTGKSTFINALKGDDENEYAEAGEVETTQDMMPYRHPENPLITLWDLPGVGTMKHPKATYLEEIIIDRYDCFVIMTATRFTEIDAWLGLEVKKRNKRIYFVRTKVSYDVDSHAKQYNTNTASCNPAAAVVEIIRTDIENYLKANGIEAPVFVIDSYDKQNQNYDFDNLCETICKDLPENQRRAMLLSLSAHMCGTKMIKVKLEELRRRQWKIALKAAGAGAIPLFGIFFNLNFVMEEAHFCYYQLALDDQALCKRARAMSIGVAKYQAVVKKEFPNGITEEYVKSVVRESVDDKAGIVLHQIFGAFPVLGAIVASPASASYTYHAFDVLLNRMESVALKIAEM